MIASLIAALLISGTPSSPADAAGAVGIVVTDDAQETEQTLYNKGRPPATRATGIRPRRRSPRSRR